MSAVVYEPVNRTMFFVTDFFLDKGLSAQISFKQQIVVGQAVNGNSVLAEIQWSDGSTEDILSPVVGVIDFVNDKVDHGRLHKRVQRALTLRRGATSALV